jgi:GAF domain-containing protein
MTAESTAEYLLNLALTGENIESYLNSQAAAAAEYFGANGTEVFCSITLLRHRKARTVGSSGERAALIDEIQYRLAEGPCLNAAESGAVVHVPDLASEEQWPNYGPRALEQGVRSIYALPMPVDNESKAALNLYSVHPHAFTEAAIARVEDHIRHASQALRVAVRLSRAADLETNLKAALQTRTAINLATGIIMDQNQCGQDEAFQFLVSASSARNIKLHDLASGIVRAVGCNPVTTHFDG